MKLTFLNSSYLPSKGGVENSLYFLSRESISIGNDTLIIAGGEYDDVSINENNVKVIRYKSPSNFLKRSLSLLNILKSIDSDLYISRNFHTTVVALLAKKNVIYVLPAIYRNQNSPSNINNESITYKVIYGINCFLEKIAINRCQKIFVFSHSMKKQVKDFGIDREVTLVNPGVDSDIYHKPSATEKTLLKEKYSLPNNKKLLLGLGRMVQIKGFQYAIEAMQYLDENFHLVLVGDGVYKNELMALASSLKVENKVSFFTFTSAPQDFYKLSDVFLMTSLYEPFGQVILEAVACGLRVVSFSNELAEVETATDEIFIGTASLNLKAKELTGTSLSDAILEVNNQNTPRYIDEYSDFIKKYSWNKLLNDLCNK